MMNVNRFVLICGKRQADIPPSSLIVKATTRSCGHVAKMNETLPYMLYHQNTHIF